MSDQDSNIPYGFCQCGCGKKPPLAKKTRSEHGRVKGNPIRFINGHNGRKYSFGMRMAGGYIKIHYPNHNRADRDGYVMEHILVIENAFGRLLRPDETIHHIDENRSNNSIGNLLVFKTNSMHLYYHRRLESFRACGHWNWRKCWICKQWDSPNNLIINHHANHRLCVNDYYRIRKTTHN